MLCCPNCKKFFNRTQNYDYHLKRQVCQKNYVCDLCNSVCKTRNALKTHIIRCKKSMALDTFYKTESLLNIIQNSTNIIEKQSNIMEKQYNEIIKLKDDTIDKQNKIIKLLQKDLTKNISNNENNCISNYSIGNNSTRIRDNSIGSSTSTSIDSSTSIGTNIIDTSIGSIGSSICSSTSIDNSTSIGNIGSSTIIGSIGNDNSITNNTINVIGFGKEDLTKLDYKEIFRCLKCGFNFPTELTMYVNFNEKYPEYHNILLNNVRSSTVKLYDGAKWCTYQFEDFFDDLLNLRLEYVDNIKDTKLYECLHKSSKNAIEKLNDLEKTNPTKYRDVRKNLRNKLIDNRNMVINTHKKKN